jgi:hypothetical protein
LEETVVEARRTAESAATAALATLAVDQDRAFEQMPDSDRRLRRALRAKSRQLGGDDALIAEVAYQHWHRMLFARFLAENGLLIHPDHGVGVSLTETAELAQEEGESDPWVLVARYAARMLPAIFRSGDPILEVRFAPEGRQRLEALLQGLPPVVFTSDDGLGWVYQFWQSEKWKEVNLSGKKIGAAELPAVTQLFTEDYMVRFLLENSLGAWWAARRPESPLIKRFTYLRLTEDGTPAAGSFKGWPDRAADVTVMDPCCGSGHFLTVAFDMLTAMRMEEEGLSLSDAGDFVIAQNLFGLEIDPRCTQIGAFALALAAWRSGGYRELPRPNIACSGVGVAGQLADWKKLAESDQDLENALSALHEQFRHAPELGSLIDPRRASEEGRLFSVEYDKVAPLLEELLFREEDPETRVAGWAAAGIARAASLLARTYTLVATNVPYLARGKQDDILKEFCARNHPDAKADLATAMLDRCYMMIAEAGSCSSVSPQNWLFLGSYRRFRTSLLSSGSWSFVVRVGSGGFSQISGAIVNVVLSCVSWARPAVDWRFFVVDAGDAQGPTAKDELLKIGAVEFLSQALQLSNPDSRIGLSQIDTAQLLARYAGAFAGVQTGDISRFGRVFWELPAITAGWERFQGTVPRTTLFGGRSQLLLWEGGRGAFVMFVRARLGEGGIGAWIRGLNCHGKWGVAISQTGDVLPATIYTGDFFDLNTAVILPNDPAHLAAIWAFCSSAAYRSAVRSIDDSLKVTNKTLAKVPFDLEHWTKVTAGLFPNGLPEPYSDDLTQWLFKGDITSSTEPLQVAVARLLGYRWPDQEAGALDEFADVDGAVPIPPIAREASAAERLRALLERAYGDVWSPGMLTELLAQVGASGTAMGTWLRDSFFAAHAKLFHNRPFIWHIWDGRKDGFGVLVNYHRLDGKLLSRIAHTLLGSWVELQRDQIRAKLPGAEGRLAAAEELQRKLMLIAEGEPPYDIYVRWKPLAEQPIGWEPDLNDGVRVNIRPFVKAGVLRSNFTINWNKDRGKDPDGSERVNDRHIPRVQKLAAREKAGTA